VSGAFGLLNAYLMKKNEIKPKHVNYMVYCEKTLIKIKPHSPHVSNFRALWQIYWLIDLKLKSAVE